MIVLLIKEKDYSGNVVADKYDVAEEPIYKTWIDGYGVEHRTVLRNRVTGSFDMFFETMDEYEIFLEDLRAMKNSNNTYTLNVALNYPENKMVSKNFYIKFKATRKLDGMNEEIMSRFTMNIKEA